MAECKGCNGSGSCTKCGGTGRVSIPLGKADCNKCGGSGNCIVCKGTGKT
jgi:hypothetical protein